MKRNEWKFTYTAATLAEAAKAKRKNHGEKRVWWEEKKKEVMDKVSDGGIEVHDSLAASYSNTKGICGPQITIDATLQRDLSEAQSKIMEHHRMCQEYEGWIQVLEGNPKAHLELEHDDYLFFFGE